MKRRVGDAVVELAVRAALFRRHPEHGAGELHDAKKPFVEKRALANVASRLGLSPLMLRGGSLPVTDNTEKVLEELYEAAIAAVFFDSDFATAAALVETHLLLPGAA